MSEQKVPQSVEQRIVIKFLGENVPSAEIHHRLQQQYGEECLRVSAFTPRKDLVPIVHEAGWAPGLAWIGAENLAPTRIRTLELPARSKSLYQLRYPSPHMYDGSPTKSSKP